MSGTNDVEMKDQAPDNSDQLGDVHTEDQAEATKNVEYDMPSVQQEEEMIKKKYGGLIPKKKPLISKDHEHAFFDSADWALGKQGAHKPKGPLEALRPKLQINVSTGVTHKGSKGNIWCKTKGLKDCRVDMRHAINAKYWIDMCKMAVEQKIEKVKPTPHHQARSRRSAYAPADDDGMHSDHHDSSEENGKTENAVSNDETSHG